ncbi:hypothetical protein O1M54_43245 [Streptomyces diastatochromogenes]|nr:hypothetical protein [Streptomyces diastatochromogenes]
MSVRSRRVGQRGDRAGRTGGHHYLVLVALADRALRRDRLRIADLSARLAGASDPFSAAAGPPR